MNQIIIAFDVDDVVINLRDEWVRRYNKDFDDDLKPEEITDWKISQFVKEEAREKIYDYIKDPEIYTATIPIEGIIEVINCLKNNFRVIFITADAYNDGKFLWLKRYGLLDSLDDYVVAHDKSIVNFEYLIDDKPDTITKLNGRGILYSQPWNIKETDYTVANNKRIDNWQDFLKTLKEMEKE